MIGMTNIPEARLAREAEICYATVALATDYDCWHDGHDDVSVEAVIAVIQQNVATARQIIRETVLDIAAGKSTAACGCGEALKFAVMTDASLIPAETRSVLEPLIGKYLAR